MIAVININTGFVDYFSTIETELSVNQLAIEYNGNFLKPQWNGSVWVEGATLEENTDYISSIYLPKIQKIFTENRFKAKCLVIDKQGDESYIEAQRESYETKYRVANGTITNQALIDAQELEALDLGIDLPTLQALIIQKYELAEDRYYRILSLNESCRTRIQTHVENGDIIKTESCLNIYKELVSLDFENTFNTLMSV